ATSDLSGFDTYLLAAACAQFTLPVITGIGHERDDTVPDMVAHTRVKTPTAAAEFLINQMNETAGNLASLAKLLKSSVSIRIEQEKKRLDFFRNRIPSLSLTYLSEAKFALLVAKNEVARAVTAALSSQKHRLDLLRQRISDTSPEHLLSRGYSITMKDGKVLTDASQLSAGDVFVTRLAKGKITGKVVDIDP
ncbi:Exodeoxyribonuclease 7 large subunit, partial [termite gut metagenome]